MDLLKNIFKLFPEQATFTFLLPWLQAVIVWRCSSRPTGFILYVLISYDAKAM